ncbi:MAG: NYN domain-containing protein [Candidatus Liptonbacteria bacterium]|nr:NYN domain-containing protein [Candidatus Liptonbacteria bacterium]
MNDSTPLRTYAFIDASNIIYGCRASGWKMDFEKLAGYLRSRYQVSRLLYYGGEEIGNASQMAFHNKLRLFGYELVVKPVKEYLGAEGAVVRKKANADVDLTFEAMLYWNEYDRAIFLTGDGDFYRLIAHCLIHKDTTWLMGNARRTAKELKVLFGARFTNLDSIRDLVKKNDV